jgi:holliday junction DNA helicase RuvA
MIASVAGEVLARRADHVVIDAGGVGYALAVSAETLKAVPAVGEPARLHAHLVARDDSISLYGFASDEERNLFLKLISVSGVGPKVGLAVLSGGAVRELLIAIAAGDAKRFQAVPGIGKRTAERIIVELRDKVAGEIDGGAGEISITAAGPDDPRGLAREGLLNLGYSLAEAEGLLDRASGDTPEEIVQSALRSAAGARAA